MKVTIDGIDYIPDPAQFNLIQTSEFKWGKRSLDNLSAVRDELVSVFDLALSRSPIDMAVIDGTRTIEEQRELFESGDSSTMNSRHLTGHALDVVPIGANGKISWAWPLYYKIEPIIKQAAKDLNVDIEWGGDWKRFPDGPHWQLSWRRYPS